MSKLNLTNLSSLQNEQSAITIINNNNDAIEAAVEKTLSRDGTVPNQMTKELDMNSNRVLNLPQPLTDAEPVRLADLNAVVVPNLGNGNVIGPVSAVGGNVAIFSGTTGKILADGGINPTTLAPKASPTFTGTATTPNLVATTSVTSPVVTVRQPDQNNYSIQMRNVDKSKSRYFRVLDDGSVDLINNAGTASTQLFADNGDVNIVGKYYGDGTTLTGVETTAHASATYAPITRGVNVQSGTSYTFVLSDAGKVVFFGNSSPVTVTIPHSSTVSFPVGTQIDLVSWGTGKVTFQGAGGVTIFSLSNNKSLLGNNAGGTLITTGGDNWWLLGSLQA